ncbi:MAG: hypothetical protein ICV73_16105, partial [Acetobacteraceae bacterium]|nr:hypothetical protein [Acetobacteraceae bacterium]
MAAGEREGVDSLLREVMTVLRKAYDVGRADALREAAAMLAASAPPAAALDPGQDAAPPASHRRGPAERGRARRG